MCLSVLHQRQQFLCHHAHHLAAPRVCLLHPFLRILHSVRGRLVQHVIEVPLCQLHEIPHHAALASAEVLQSQPVRAQYLHRRLALLPVALLRLGHYVAHRAFVVVKELIILKHLLHPASILLEVLLEDVATKGLYLAYHVPVLAVSHVVVDIVHHDLLQLLVIGYGIDHLIHGLIHHLLCVQPHSEVGGQHQFLSQVSQHILEERINGLHPEVMVVVQQ